MAKKTQERVLKSAVDTYLQKLNSDSTSLAENSLSFTTDFIDTGNYALNAIISGSLYGGIPAGKVTGLSGPSKSGKSYIAAKVISNAQKLGYRAIVWDSEGAWDARMRGLGVDVDNCRIMPVATIEETKNQMLKTLDFIKENAPNEKFIFILDSLGALSSQKEIDDALLEKTAIDMGTKAKVIKAMFRMLTIKCNTLRIPLLFTNHIYDNPAEMYKSVIKNQAGGSGPAYMASIAVQLGLQNEKIDGTDDSDEDGDMPTDRDVLGIASNFKGAIIPVMTTKNRFIPAFLKCQLYINFVKGLDRYSGLFEMGRSMGVILGTRTYTLSDGTSLGHKKDFIRNYELWDKTIIPMLDKELQKTITYSSITDADKLVEDIEE
jgi:RecA/RadA recombinase